jgi:hypothetical protein
LQIVFEACVVEKRISSEVNCRINVDLVVIEVDKRYQLLSPPGDHKKHQFLLYVDEVICGQDHRSGIAPH